MTDPILITSDAAAVPKRHWERPITSVHDMGEVFRYEVCSHCRKPIRDHIWFLIDRANDQVSDCSEVAL